jgi:transcriptional regulator with XRE-family HTH domain
VLIDLKVLLLRKGISQKELAGAIDLSCGQVSRLINGRVRLRASHKRRIAQFLRVPQSQISARKRTRGMSASKGSLCPHGGR